MYVFICLNRLDSAASATTADKLLLSCKYKFGESIGFFKRYTIVVHIYRSYA